MKLRKLKLEDASLMLEWMHDKSVVQDLKKDFASMTIENCQNFIKASTDESENIHMAIVSDEDEYMGTVSLKDINWEKKSAEFGITVRTVAMGKGYSAFGMKEIIRYGLEEKGLSKIYWCVSRANQRAVRFYDKNEYERIEYKDLDETVDYTEEEIESYVWYQVRKPRVLFLPMWYFPRNAEVMTNGVFHYEQAMSLSKYCDMALYWPFDSDEHPGFYKAEERGLLTYRNAPAENTMTSKMKYVMKTTPQVIKDFKPDIIHAHVARGAGQVAIYYGKKYHIPVVLTEHNPMELAGLEKKSTKHGVGMVYRLTKGNYCVSKDLKKRLQEVYPKYKFNVIYNGVIDPNTTEDDGQKYAVDGYVNFAIVAAFYSRDIKGYQYLIPAMKELKSKGVKVKLHICGGGDYQSEYEEMAKSLGVEEDCIFYGQCDRKKVYSIVRQMDFNISASIFECSGVSVQEAMLLGKPLVVTKSGGANSLCTKKTAIVVDKESTSAIVNGVEEMIQKLDQFDAEEIKKYARENFEIDHVSRKYKRVYDLCMKKK